jgi:hypothetical protein
MKTSFLIFMLLFSIPLLVFADRFPSEDELDGIIKGCGIGISKKVQADVSASVKSWRKAAIKGEASYSELGSILQESQDGTISSANYKTYTSCVIELVREFNKPLTAADCKNPIYKVGRGPVCGVEKYKALASVRCGVLEYNTGTGAQCGVDQYYRCETGACGWNACGFIKKCDAKECRHPNCGVERYKTCKHPDFGVRTYKTCRDPSNGVETYKACRNEEFGFERCG